jgi:hypothetical protein
VPRLRIRRAFQRQLRGVERDVGVAVVRRRIRIQQIVVMPRRVDGDGQELTLALTKRSPLGQRVRRNLDLQPLLEHRAELHERARSAYRRSAAVGGSRRHGLRPRRGRRRGRRWTRRGLRLREQRDEIVDGHREIQVLSGLERAHRNADDKPVAVDDGTAGGSVRDRGGYLKQPDAIRKLPGAGVKTFGDRALETLRIAQGVHAAADGCVRRSGAQCRRGERHRRAQHRQIETLVEARQRAGHLGHARLHERLTTDHHMRVGHDQIAFDDEAGAE